MKRVFVLGATIVVALSLLVVSFVFADGADDAAEIAAAQKGASAGEHIIYNASATRPVGFCPMGTVETTVPITDSRVTVTADPAGEWEYGIPITVTSVITNDVDCDFPASTMAPPTPPNGPNVWGTDLDGCYPPAGASTPLSFDFDFPTVCDGTALDNIMLDFDYYYNAFPDFDEILFIADGTTVFSDTTGGAGTTVGWSPFTALLSPTGNFTVDFQPSTVVQYAGLYLDFGGSITPTAVTFCDCQAALAVSVADSTTSAPTTASPSVIFLVLGLFTLTLGGLYVNKR